MSLLALLPLLLSLAICFAPIWLLRGLEHRRAQDYFVTSQYVRPEVIRNSSIAYGLRVAALGPLFLWGARGDLWPAIIAATCFGLGIYMVYILRRPLLAFVDDALSRDQSITVHEFVARQHGNHRRVRLLTSSLSLFALLGLMVAEVLAVAAVLKPMQPDSTWAVYMLVIGVIMLTVLQVFPAGQTGAMQSGQLQLGMLYLGLFGLAAVLLYLQVSALTSTLPYSTFATAAASACCAIMLAYRSSKYVDTYPVRLAPQSRPSRGARFLSRLGKIFNIAFSVLLILIIALAILGFQAKGVAPIVRDTAATLLSAAQMSALELLALCLLPLLYPIVDVTTWQRLAAMRKANAGGLDLQRRPTLRRVFGMYGVENCLVWLFMSLLGSLAIVTIGAPGEADVPQRFVAQIVRGKQIDVVAPSLLLIFVFGAALSTMSGLLSASLCTIRYDALPGLWPEMAAGQTHPANEATARRRTLLAGAGLCLAVTAAFCCAQASLDANYASRVFLSLLLMSCCAQLSFAPLVLAPIIGRRRRGRSQPVGPRWALMIVGFATASAAAAVTFYLATGIEAWLWAAVPVCIGSGWVIYVVARVHGALQARNRG